MTSTSFLRAFLREAVRNRVTIGMLIIVPTVFVMVASQSLANSAKIFEASVNGAAVDVATAGWAAGFVAAIAMYFQIRAARATDQRLVLAGLAPTRLMIARMGTGMVLAGVAAAVSLLALQIRTGIGDPGRVVAGTIMFALVYLAIGAVVGALVANPVNGTVLIMFLWMLDLVFGPVFGSAGRAGTRALPTHYLTLWMTGQPSHHAGRLGDLGWALIWTAAALAVSAIVIAVTSRAARPRHHRSEPGSWLGQFVAGTRAALRQAGRNRLLWVLLVALPAAFVLLARWTTPSKTGTAPVTENGRQVMVSFWFPDVHPGLMTPAAIGAMAAIIGVYALIDSRAADGRLVLAGFRPGSLLASRLVVIALLALVVEATALAMTATVFTAQQWGLYIAANTLVALVFVLIGVLIGALFGRIGGIFVAVLIPVLDLVLTQSPMVHPILPGWARALPGWGPSRMLYTAALTPASSNAAPLLAALAWLVGLTLAVILLFRHTTATARRTTSGGAAPIGRQATPATERSAFARFTTHVAPPKEHAR